MCGIFAVLSSNIKDNGDFEKQMEKLSKLEINRKWQKYMEKYFVKKDKSILGPEVEILEEVFHLD